MCTFDETTVHFLFNEVRNFIGYMFIEDLGKTRKSHCEMKHFSPINSSCRYSQNKTLGDVFVCFVFHVNVKN